MYTPIRNIPAKAVAPSLQIRRSGPAGISWEEAHQERAEIHTVDPRSAVHAQLNSDKSAERVRQSQTR